MLFGIDKLVSENIKDVSSMSFWQACIAELFGTGLLVMLGCGSCLSGDWASNESTTVQIALTFGLAVATIVWCISHISGGHINPAVSIAMFITRRITLVRLVVYVGVQMAGAVIGAMVLKSFTPARHEGNICQTTLHASLRIIDGLLVEGVITFLLIFTIFASTDSNRKVQGGSVPLTIGLVVVLNHLFAIQYTGSSINPARTFGSGVAGGTWKNHWVYWVGPIVGSLVAAFFYDFVLSANAHVLKLKHYITDSSYDPAAFYGDKKNEKEIEHVREITNC